MAATAARERVHEHGVGCPSRQRFDADRAGAGEQVQDQRVPLDRRPEAREEALAGHVGHRPGTRRDRRRAGPLGGPGDDPHAPSLPGGSRGSGLEQPLDRPLETAPEHLEQRGVPSRPGSASMSAKARARARCTSSMSSASRASFRSGMPDWLDVEQRPLAPQPEILVGQLEPVGRPHHRVQARARLEVVGSACVEQHAVGTVRAPADAAAQLVQLREAEALGVLHQHHGRVRHVDADLDHRRRDEHVRLARAERVHAASFSVGPHPAVEQGDVELGEHLGRQAIGLLLGGRTCGRFVLVDRGADDERLVAVGDLLANQLVGRGAVPRGSARPTSRSAARPAGSSSMTDTSRSP